MENFNIIATQTPGIATFDNYEEVKSQLRSYIQATFADVDYEIEGPAIATADCKELKSMRDVVTKKQKDLEREYTKPYKTVDDMLTELVKIIDVPYKKAKSFVDNEEKNAKRVEVLAYAEKQAAVLGEAGKKIIESPSFFNNKWLNKSCKAKEYQDAINAIIQQASKDIQSIQTAGGDNAPVLLASYYETLSMDSVKSIQDNLANAQNTVASIALPSDKNVLGYKVLKITATEDQMASIMDQLALMGVEVEEIEDGMPKPMEELTDPSFDSFVAFDIETTGTNGAANGDDEAKITEIGAVRVVNGQVVGKFDQLANPGRKIVPRIARLTGITDDMVKNQPPVDEVIRMFHEFVGDSTLVGHNIKSSDLRYITKAADKAGVHFDGPFLDTYLLAKKFKEEKNWEKLNLGYLADQYSFEHKEVHRAWSDAEVNAQLYFELQKLSGK